MDIFETVLNCRNLIPLKLFEGESKKTIILRGLMDVDAETSGISNEKEFLKNDPSRYGLFLLLRDFFPNLPQSVVTKSQMPTLANTIIGIDAMRKRK